MTEPLDPRHIAAAARLWQREQREVVTSFSGVSMLPSIRPGDPLRLRFTPDTAVGDVVLCIAGDQIVLHRLIARSSRWLLTQGDANVVPDAPWPREGALACVLDPPAAPDRFRHALARALVQRICLGVLRVSQRLGTRIIAAFVRAERLYAGRGSR